MKFEKFEKYDITKHFPKKHVLQKYDFLFVWNANLIFFKENFLFVIISVENRVFIQEKNFTLNTYNIKFLQNYVFFMNGIQI